MEEKKLLGETIEQFQLTLQEIIENWVNEKKVDSVFLSEMTEKAKVFENMTFIPSKLFVMPRTVFLPSYKEGRLLFSETGVVSQALQAAKLDMLEYFLDLSSEYDAMSHWIMRCVPGIKNQTEFVRPVLDLSYLSK